MSRPFDNKVAVVTGASRGLGRMLAGQFAQAGARVAFCARREEPLRILEAELRSSGHEAMAVVADVSRHDDCGRLIDAAAERWGRIDILVNNAGISGAQKPIRDLGIDEFDEAMRTNLYSVFSCIHFASKYMIEQKSGAIVNISSGIGKAPVVLRTAYGVSKMAIVGLTRVVALELGLHKVRCNTISPGWIQGERGEEVVANMAKARNISPERAREILVSGPLREAVTGQDICDTVLFLCSDSGRHITGQDINVNSGSIMF